MRNSLLLLVFASSVLVACGSDRGHGALDAAGDAPDAHVDADAAIDAIVAPDGSGDVGSGLVDTSVDAGCDSLGCPCDADADCASGYCVDGGSRTGSVCSELCSETCSEPGYECVVLVNSGVDAVQLCVPIARSFCDPCDSDRACGRLGNYCLAFDDGEHCATDCSATGVCPPGGVCTEVDAGGETRTLCVPEFDACGDCVDADEDGYGAGCAEPDCDDENAAVNPGATELCDDVDNDCDTRVDEGFDTDTDPLNCGGCGVVCDGDNSAQYCQDGACFVDGCDDGWSDCDGDAETGCERADEALNACGGCAELSGAPDDACGTCGSGTLACDGVDALTCVGDGGDAALNACGGCATLPETVDAACGTCGSGAWACDGTEGVACAGDAGDGALNACGGCATLPATRGAPCGPCLDGEWACGGAESLVCVAATPDSDSDGVCDDADICPGFDDGADDDSDGVPNGCDVCLSGADDVDTDSDGVADACDVCSAGDDTLDADGDDTPDACDCDQAACSPNATCTERDDGASCACNAGYVGDGATCEPVDCGAISSPNNGGISLSGTGIGDTATATCNVGWTLQGDAERTCGADGNWSGTVATCYRPPGDLWCACSRTYSVGSRVRSIVAAPSGHSSIGVGRMGTVISASNKGPGFFDILVQFDGWNDGHNGRCDYSTCGTCSESGSSRTWIPCSSVEPVGPP